MIFLQVALDLLRLDDSLRIASEVYPYIDIIEAGTPLIKSEGIRAVSVLKKEFPDRDIFADLKIMDAGALEVRMAIDAGADIISVCAQATRETVISALEEVKRLNKKIMIDLIGSEDYISKAKELDSLSPDYFCVHTAIDEQIKGKRPFEGLDTFHREINSPYSIAGGIKPEDIPFIMRYNPSIIIVGGFITKARRPEDAVKRIREAINEGLLSIHTR